MDTKPQTRFKDLTFKEKISFISEYYKYHIILAVVILIIIGSVVDRILNPPPAPFAQIAYINLPMITQTYNNLHDKLNGDIQFDKENYSLEMYDFNLNSNDASMNLSLIQKFMSMVAAKELDLIICDDREFSSLAEQDYFMDLTVLLTEDEMGAYKKHIVNAQNSQNEEKAFGISLSGNKLFGDLGINVDKHYLSVVINTQRTDNAMTMFRYILSRF